MRNNWWKIAVVVALVVIVAVVIAGKDDGKNEDLASVPDVTSEAVSPNADMPSEPIVPENKPAVEEQQSAKPSEPNADTSKTNTQAIKQVKPDEPDQKPVQKKSVQPSPQDKPVTAKKAPAKLPKLIDLGATKCIPCKMMAPILEELARDYKGQLEVQFIDVWENQGEGQKYGIRSIPTQIFYDAHGKEFFRHEGFFAKEDILAKFKEQGIKLTK